jgi:hypothetical protein
MPGRDNYLLASSTPSPPPAGTLGAWA